MSDTIGICLETLLLDRTTASATDYARVADAAAAAGFRTAAVWAGRIEALGVGAARRLFDDAGLNVRLVECLTFWADGPDAALKGLDHQLDIAQAVGAPAILAVAQQSAFDHHAAAEGFAALCDQASIRGIRVAIEFIPYRGLDSLATAWAIVRDSGAPNGGINLDLMHWQHQPGGPNLDLLRCVPGRHVLYVQVCDTDAATPGPDAYIRTAVTERRLPGEGVVDIAAILDILRDREADPFMAMEVFNTNLAASGPDLFARRLRQAADALRW